MVILIVTIGSLLFIAYPRKNKAKKDKIAYLLLSTVSIALLILYICGYFPAAAELLHTFMIAVIQLGGGHYDA